MHRVVRTMLVASILAAAGVARAQDPPAEPPGFAVAGPRGFGFRADGGFELFLHGFVSTDMRTFVGDRPVGVVDRATFAVRAAGLQLDALLYRRIKVQLLANLADRASPVTTAFVELEAAPWLRLRVGKFPFPMTQERLTSPLSLPFVGSSLPMLLIPPFDTGVQLHGALLDDQLAFNLAVVNGAVPGGTGDADTDTGKDVVARLFARPFRSLGVAPLASLGLGVGASWGIHRGTPAAPGLPVLRTYGAQVFFAYRADGTPIGTTVADGGVMRIAPHLVWAWGPVALQAEGVQVWERAADTTLRAKAIDVIPSVALTGEDAQPLSFVVPRRPLGGPDGGIGAVIVVGGAGWLAIDDDAFPAQADPEATTAGMSVLGAGVKWYPVAGIALFIDYGHMTFRTPPGGVTRANEDTAIARLQLIL